MHLDHQAPAHCLHCVEGWAPAGWHPVLGPVYRVCPTAPPCDTCAGVSMFPADFDDPRSVALLLVSHGITLGICPACLGVTVAPAATTGTRR